jgi:Flp pilus assembly protein TadD
VNHVRRRSMPPFPRILTLGNMGRKIVKESAVDRPPNSGWRWAIALIASALVAFSSAIPAPFVFDDIPGIEHNLSIRQLMPPSVPLQPPRDTPVAGRPVANVSLAINYAVNDLLGIDQDPTAHDARRTIGYRLFNILLHSWSGLLLFGVVRRTIRSSGVAWLNPDRTAGLAALLWLLHPIQTEAVDYAIQRTELIVSLFYLLTLYCSIRAWQTDLVTGRRTQWMVMAVLACAAGMGSKEVMITAPLMIVLYDRVFFFESWTTLRRDTPRLRLYAALFATSLIVVVYVATGARSHSVGFQLGLTWYDYLRTQLWAIARYVRLIVWPNELTFDYGDAPVGGARALVGGAGLSVSLAAVAIAWRRPGWKWLAFAGLWFFIILAPSSSVIPIKTEIAAERRVYLASAALFTTAVIGGEFLRHRFKLGAKLIFFAGICLAAVLGIVTFGRGFTFRSQEALFRDVVAKAPTNPRGYVGLGLAIVQRGPGQLPEATMLFRQALSVDSNSFPAWQSLGIASVLQSQWGQASEAFRHALRLEPGNLDADAGMARAQIHLGQPDSAALYIERIGSADPEALWMLGAELLKQHRSGDAVRYLELSATAMPSGPGAAMLSVAYAESGNGAAAVQAAAFATRNAHNSPVAYVLAGRAMRLVHRTLDAEAYLTHALMLDPSSIEARAELDSLRRR